MAKHRSLQDAQSAIIQSQLQKEENHSWQIPVQNYKTWRM